MSASSLSDLLASQLPLCLATRARELLSTQAALDRALPAALAGHVRVMQLANGLRHQTDALMAGLARNGIAVTSVRVSVNPDLLPRYTHRVEKAGVPPSALDSLAHLNAEIEDGPLKDALDHLLHHHRKN
jgi:hypothetical protein